MDSIGIRYGGKMPNVNNEDVEAMCEQQRPRSTCTIAQTDKKIICSLYLLNFVGGQRKSRQTANVHLDRLVRIWHKRPVFAQ